MFAFTQSDFYKHWVGHMRAALGAVVSMGVQFFSAGSLDAMASWTWKRWVLGVVAVVVPYIALAMRADGQPQPPVTH